MPEVIVIEPRKMQQQPKIIRACAYARVSTEQDSQSNSYETQITYYREEIKKRSGWVLVDIYSDKGITGTSAEKRPGFQQMIKDCQAGEIDCILVKSVSRFSRNTEEGLYYIRKLKEWDVNVIFEKENINTSSLDDELLLTFLNCLSEEESRSISRNIRWSIKRRMQQGEFITAYAPYGYRLEHGNLVGIPEELDIVKWIYDSFLSGMNCETIARILNESGSYKKSHDNKWTASGVRYILLNEKYAGDALVQKTVTSDTLPFTRTKNQGQQEQYYIENCQIAVIEKEKAERVKALFARKRHPFETKETRLLSGKVYCAKCGTKMRYKKSRGNVYWACQLHEKDITICDAENWDERVIYKAFQNLYRKLKANYTTILIPALRQMELLYQTKQPISLNNDTDEEIIHLQKQIQVLNRLMSRGHLESAFYMEKIAELHQQLDAKNVEKYMHQLRKEKRLYRVKQLIKIFEQGPAQLDEISKELFEQTVEKILLTKQGSIQFQMKGGFEFEERVEKGRVR